MPCNGGPDPTPEDYERSFRAVQKREKEIKDQINKLTRMLCNLFKVMEDFGASVEGSSSLKPKDQNELLEWQKNHAEWDKQRLAAAKKTAIAKLTDEEREALGL